MSSRRRKADGQVIAVARRLPAGPACAVPANRRRSKGRARDATRRLPHKDPALVSRDGELQDPCEVLARDGGLAVDEVAGILAHKTGGLAQHAEHRHAPARRNA